MLWFVVVPRYPVLCPVFCGALLPFGAVLWRPDVCFPLLVVLVCVFSLCVRCCVALRVVLFPASWVCAVVGASCRGVLLCVVVSPWAFCGVVVVLWCVTVSCVLRPVLCSAVLCCLAVLCWLAVLCTCLRCWGLFSLLSSFPLLKTPAVFPYL